MKRALTIFVICANISLFGQFNPTKKAKPIVEEGKLLYRSEMASWYGSDWIMSNYNSLDSIGGYFSYLVGDSARCVFFSRAKKPLVLASITFDESYSIPKSTTSLKPREFTKTERDLHEIRVKALKEINSDTLFKRYENINFNLIPLIDGKEKKVYVLSGPKKAGVVVFGNDYLLTFNKRNVLKTKRCLHNNIISIPYNNTETENAVGSVHTHSAETGNFITATDVCTLMLYAKFAGWKTHQVYTQDYLNIWNCETEQLTVISMKTIKKINEHQAKKNNDLDK